MRDLNEATPVFNGADENDIMDTLEMANDYANKTWEEFEERWGDKVNDDIMKYLWDNRDHREEWKGVPIDRTGKVQTSIRFSGWGRSSVKQIYIVN